MSASLKQLYAYIDFAVLVKSGGEAWLEQTTLDDIHFNGAPVRVDGQAEPCREIDYEQS